MVHERLAEVIETALIETAVGVPQSCKSETAGSSPVTPAREFNQVGQGFRGWPVVCLGVISVRECGGHTVVQSTATAR